MTIPDEINIAILEALGIPNTGRVSGATINLRAGHYPEVEVEYWVMHTGAFNEMRRVASKFHLKPCLEP